MFKLKYNGGEVKIQSKCIKVASTKANIIHIVNFPHGCALMMHFMSLFLCKEKALLKLFRDAIILKLDTENTRTFTYEKRL
jgi:hypothetical protein